MTLFKLEKMNDGWLKQLKYISGSRPNFFLMRKVSISTSVSSTGPFIFLNKENRKICEITGKY